MYECQVYQRCGVQRALKNRLLAEQNLQAKTLIASINEHMRDQRRSRAYYLRMLNNGYHRE
eukprot:2313152-Prorocentrum_lima.AAC.1